MLFSHSAFAIKSDFQTVKQYHDQEIEQLIKDYTLEEALTIRMEIKKKEGSKLGEPEVVNLPGIYQKSDSGEDIEKVFNMYERKFVFIKKREITEQELDLVKKSLTERLFLPADTSFTTIENMTNVDNAVKNIKADFLMGAYKTLIQGGQFLWILIFSIGFILALYILAKVWKSKSDSGGEMTLSGGGAGAGNANGDSQTSIESATSHGDNLGNTLTDLETFNFKSLCQNLNQAYESSPGSTAHLLWQSLPGMQTQIQFVETIKIQTNVAADVLEQSLKILDQVFDFKSRSGNKDKKRAIALNKNILSQFSVDLAKLSYSEKDENIEKCFAKIYPSKADHLSLVFKSAMNDHSLTLYKLFKDQYMNFISSQSDNNMVSKLNDLVTFDPDVDEVPVEKLNAFVQFLDQFKVDEQNISKEKSVNSKVVEMMCSLSENELDKVDALKSNEQLKAEVPTFNWIQLTDTKVLKDFFAELNAAELKTVLDYNEDFNKSIGSFDERTQFRIKEKIAKSDAHSVNWKVLRGKIKNYYKYEANNGNQEKKSA